METRFTMRECLSECLGRGLIRLSTPKEEGIERDFLIVREIESKDGELKKPVELVEIVIDVNDFYLRDLARSNCREELQKRYSSKEFIIEDYSFINLEDNSFPRAKKTKSSDYL